MTCLAWVSSLLSFIWKFPRVCNENKTKRSSLFGKAVQGCVMKLICRNLQTLLSCLFCKTTFKGEHDNFFLDFSGEKKKKKKAATLQSGGWLNI